MADQDLVGIILILVMGAHPCPPFSLLSWFTCAGSLDQHGEAGDGNNDGEHAQEKGIGRLQVQPAETAGVDFDQPEGVNSLLKKQAVKGPC